MLALALWQPWASLLVASDPANAGNPPKEWETRSWHPRPTQLKSGDRFAITATARIPAQYRAALIRRGEFVEPYASILDRCGFSVRDPWEIGYNPTRGLPVASGAVVGSVVFDRWHYSERATEEIGFEKRRATSRVAAIATELQLGDYAPGRCAWRVRLAVPCVPYELASRQGLFAVDEDVDAHVRRSVALANERLAGMVAR